MKRARIKQTYKPKGYDAEAAERWFRAVVHPRATCLVCKRRGRGVVLQAHHVLDKQHIESFARSERLSDEERNRLLWNVANGVALCVRCHEKHTNRVSPIPRHLIPEAAWSFCRSLVPTQRGRGPEWAVARLERAYPE